MDVRDSELYSPPTEKVESQYGGMRFPSLLARIKAVFIDTLIILSIFTATTLIIDAIGEVPNVARGFVLIFMFYLYDPLLTSFTGSTIGHKAMKLTVRRYTDPGKTISLGQAFIRFLVKGLLGWISFLTVTSNRRKRALHDLASGSIILVSK